MTKKKIERKKLLSMNDVIGVDGAAGYVTTT